MTLGFVVLLSFHQGAKEFTHRNPQLMIIPMIGTFVLLCVIACCENARRNSPMNLILLGAFTLCESLMVGFISSTYDPKIVSFISFDSFWHFNNNFSFQGCVGCWINCCDHDWTYDFCLPNPIWLYRMRWGNVHHSNHLHNRQYRRFDFLPRRVHKLHICMFRSWNIRNLHCLRHANDDG